MIISAATDYREAAKRKLPRFLFDYLDGGAYSEMTLRNNVSDLSSLALRQRVVGWLPGEIFHGTVWRAGLPRTMGTESPSKARASMSGTEAAMESAA